MSDELENYFLTLKNESNIQYEIAKKARAQGKDCNIKVEIPQAEDLAGRVQALTGIEASDIIKKLSKQYDRERVAIEAAVSVSENFDGPDEIRIEKGLRVALAILTEGILVAPLEGITGVKIKQRDGNNYLAIYYSGPIRSAGGTAQALSVFVGDLLRRKFGIGKYIASQEEVERCKEEIPLYARVQHLQYIPTMQEIETAVEGSPVCITGEGTEEAEITGHRNLPDIETNRLRGGMALVIAEGLILKGPKLKKYVSTFGLEGWSFSSEKKEEKNLFPNSNYLKEMLAGRPALSYPSRKGGFRLRYGRSRNTGLAAVAINPVTMKVLDDFIALGTQIKMERPGKAGAVVANSNLEGPTVLLESGSLVRLKDDNSFKEHRNEIKEIIDLGEMMISFGEFIENNKVLFPGAFTDSWWRQICERKIGSIPVVTDEKSAIDASIKFNIPLHPSFTYLWHDVSSEDIQLFSEILENDSRIRDNRLELPITDFGKRFLADLLCEYEVADKIIVKNFLSLVVPLGMNIVDGRLYSGKKVVGKDVMKAINELAGFPIYPKGLSRIGARMGRPEKAEERKMNPPVHVLFPIGNVTKNRRDLNQYDELQGTEMQVRQCSGCGNLTFTNVCEKCGAHTTPTEKTREFDITISEILRRKGEQLGIVLPKKVNGVRGLTSSHKTPEPIEKGILRASMSIYPFKDGTCRFDMSDVPLTHARLDEIGLTLEKAKSMGYSSDYRGNDLVETSQVIEIFPQDIVPSKKAGEYLLRVSNFVDELLQRFYGLDMFYGAKSKEDLIGSLIIGLAPHTSGGILGRIIGYTEGDVCYAHPFFHAAKRRNCDGDEDSIMLLLDGLLNFSMDYLPNSRGSLMDAPLVLSLRINPMEIDKEALNLDITGEYPPELLELTMKFPDPSEITKYIVTAGMKVKKGELFPKCQFSDDTQSINLGTLSSSYKSIPSMEQKLEMTLDLARRLRAVDASDMAERILKSHFIPDIMGNLNKFGAQTFRCTSCNHIYRRLPLSGKCRKCGTNLIGTVHRGNITKYLETSYNITNQYEVSYYVKQRIRIMRESVKSIFEARDNNFKTLEDFDDT
ncbi:MAG: DNA polymerase II large subunit [Thermoplasmatales archaeon]|jgi:DNA polymerase II large subunit|nr:DNA polymerase II large subunit [Candidatus Thermoplasmatota archaeon]MDA8054939.1 DNA polymerase II large subunit [Thermoplasmatales archaeon]